MIFDPARSFGEADPAHVAAVRALLDELVSRHRRRSPGAARLGAIAFDLDRAARDALTHDRVGIVAAAWDADARALGCGCDLVGFLTGKSAAAARAREAQSRPADLGDELRRLIERLSVEPSPSDIAAAWHAAPPRVRDLVLSASDPARPVVARLRIDREAALAAARAAEAARRKGGRPPRDLALGALVFACFWYFRDLAGDVGASLRVRDGGELHGEGLDFATAVSGVYGLRVPRNVLRDTADPAALGGPWAPGSGKGAG